MWNEGQLRGLLLRDGGGGVSVGRHDENTLQETTDFNKPAANFDRISNPSHVPDS